MFKFLFNYLHSNRGVSLTVMNRARKGTPEIMYKVFRSSLFFTL